MASPREPRTTTATAEASAPERPMPQEAPPLTNPPATLEQVEEELDQADKARVALGGTPGAAAQAPAMDDDEEPAAPPGPADGVWNPAQAKAAGGPRKADRFRPPQEPEFEFTPPEPQRVQNNNLPLTIGLLVSITASFVVFFVGLASGGPDPIMPAFWRALAALAVLTTLSFAASWFMPAPSDHRQLLDQLEAEDRALKRYRAVEQEDKEPAPQMEREVEAKGSSVDVTVDDDEFGDEDLFGDLPAEADNDFADEDDDDFLNTSSAQAGSAPVAGTGQ